MNCPDRARSNSISAQLPDAVKNLREFSQAEARLLGSVNYCFFPASLEESAQSQGAEENQPQSGRPFFRIPR
jgi:hypothetical protein